MKNLKMFPIEVESIDVESRTQIVEYFNQLSNKEYIINENGILNRLVQADKYQKEIQYELTYLPIVIFLDVNQKDYEIRSTLEKKPYFDISQDSKAYRKYAELLSLFGVQVLVYNVSEESISTLASKILNEIEQLNFKPIETSILLPSLKFYLKERVESSEDY